MVPFHVRTYVVATAVVAELLQWLSCSPVKVAPKRSSHLTSWKEGGPTTVSSAEMAWGPAEAAAVSSVASGRPKSSDMLCAIAAGASAPSHTQMPMATGVKTSAERAEEQWLTAVQKHALLFRVQMDSSPATTADMRELSAPT